jgi:hypothetical protein
MSIEEKHHELGRQIVDVTNKYVAENDITAEDLEGIMIHVMLCHFQQRYCDDHATPAAHTFLYRMWASVTCTALGMAADSHLDPLAAVSSSSADMMLAGAESEGLEGPQKMHALETMIFAILTEMIQIEHLREAFERLSQRMHLLIDNEQLSEKLGETPTDERTIN